MKKAILLVAALLCVAGIVLMLAQRILEWRQSRIESGPPHGRISARLPDWLGNLGLGLVALGAVLACTLIF